MEAALDLLKALLLAFQRVDLHLNALETVADFSANFVEVLAKKGFLEGDFLEIAALFYPFGVSLLVVGGLRSGFFNLQSRLLRMMLLPISYSGIEFHLARMCALLAGMVFGHG